MKYNLFSCQQNLVIVKFFHIIYNSLKGAEKMLGLDYNQQVSNELRNIPLSYHHIDDKHPFYQMPLHWHRPCEIVRVSSGKLTIYLDDNAIHASADEVIFINQEIIHGYEPDNCTYEVINVDSKAILMRTSLCKDILHTFANNEFRILPFHPIKNADLYDITNRLFRLAAQNARDEDLLLLSTLFELFGTIYIQHHYTDSFQDSKNTNRFRPLLDHIDSSFMNSVTTVEMANVCNMSPNHFLKVFHEYFGQTPHDFLNTYRLERACVLLINTDLSITDIACSCGFYDASYFVKVFKKYKGMTPKKYRTMFVSNT